MTSLVSHAPAINMASHLSPSTRMTSSYVAFNLAASWRACIRPGERRPQRLPPRLQQEVISDVDSDVIAACFRRVYVMTCTLGRIQLSYSYSSSIVPDTNTYIYIYIRSRWRNMHAQRSDQAARRRRHCLAPRGQVSIRALPFAAHARPVGVAADADAAPPLSASHPLQLFLAARMATGRLQRTEFRILR